MRASNSSSVQRPTRWVIPWLRGGVPSFEEILDPGEGRGLMSGVVIGVLYQNLGVTGFGPGGQRAGRDLETKLSPPYIVSIQKACICFSHMATSVLNAGIKSPNMSKARKIISK